MAIAEKLQIWSFLLGLLGSLFLVVSLVLGFIGTGLSEKGYWESIRAIMSEVKDARLRKQPQWTSYVRVKSEHIPVLEMPMRVILQFQLHSDDNTIPLMVRVAADSNGAFANTVAGPAGVVEQTITEPQTYYVSVSHPLIQWSSAVQGWIDPRGK